MSKLEFYDGSIMLDGKTIGWYYDGENEPTIHFENEHVKHVEPFGTFKQLTEIALRQ